jgi:hypothetical protein
MANSSNFEFGEILKASSHLKDDLRSALLRSEDTKVAGLVRELNEVRVVGTTDDAPSLSIAFVGQYDAGKSTILRVLTGREDIVIDADVCTNAVTAYDWNGVRLLDTPGIRAGYTEHDETTYAAIDRADLLVFVVTNELFDDTIGRHFRELAFARQYAPKILLVVNKMGDDPGTPETKRSDIEKVTSPLSAVDFRTLFIDALSWLEAQSATSEDRADLLEIANVSALITALNGFIAERGLAGRFSAPLFLMRSVAKQGSAFLATDFPDERAALELLHRKRGLILASRSRLRGAMGGVVTKAVADIGRFGDEVAECIEPGKSEEDVEALHTNAQTRARLRSENLSSEARECAESELRELQRQIEALRDGVLARELRGQIEGSVDGGASVRPSEFMTPMWNAGQMCDDAARWSPKARKIGDIAKNIGGWAAKWATGPMAHGAAIGSATAARGSQAHVVVFNVGKFFGAKFQPWGAVRVARAIGNAGRAIVAVGGVLAVVAQIMDDRQEEHHRLQLRDARDGVRSAYRESALSVQSAFWAQFESFLANFYDAELLALDEVVENLVGKRSQRGADAEVFGELDRRAATLIERVHATVSSSDP